MCLPWKVDICRKRRICVVEGLCREKTSMFVMEDDFVAVKGDCLPSEANMFTVEGDFGCSKRRLWAVKASMVP